MAAKKTDRQSKSHQASSSARPLRHAATPQQRRGAVVAYMQDRRVLGGPIGTLAEASRIVPDIAAVLLKQHIVNPRTGKPYSAQTIKTDLAETIGLWSYVKPLWQSRIQLHVDTAYKDYVFYDSLRRGYAPGYTISGPALCQPTAQTIASYAFGKGISVSLSTPAISSKATHTTLQEAARIIPFSEADGKPTQNMRSAKGVPSPVQVAPPKAKPSPGADDNVAYTNLQLKTMVERNQALFVATTVDEYSLGNQYVICNPDCTFSVASPETVTVDYSASDYRRPLRYIIRTKMEQATVEDVYTAEKRVVTIQYYDKRGTQTREYENLIGRIPIVHLANDRSANEIYGRPIYEGQLPLMQQYDDLLLNMIQGVKLLATPIPMFTNLDNPTETKLLNSDARQYVDENGQTQTEYTMRLDRQTGLFLGKGGDGKMLSTQVGFTKDSLDTIRQCFLLYLNGVRIPEMIWGGAIASSKASTESQMPPFIQYIQFRRLLLEGEGADPALGIEARGGLLELIDIWLRTYKLLNPAIVVGPVQIEWPEIDIYGDQTKYLWASFMKGVGSITDTTLNRMSGYIADPAAEVRAAAGLKARAPAFDAYDARLRQARLEAMQAEGEPLDDDGKFFATDYVTPLPDRLKTLNWEHPSPDLPLTIAGPAVWEHELG